MFTSCLLFLYGIRYVTCPNVYTHDGIWTKVGMYSVQEWCEGKFLCGVAGGAATLTQIVGPTGGVHVVPITFVSVVDGLVRNMSACMLPTILDKS